MKIVQIQFTPWDKVYNFSQNNIELKIGDKVVVKTDMGTDIGEVIGFLNMDEKEYQELQIKAREVLLPKDKTDEEPEKPVEENSEILNETSLKPVVRKITPLDNEKIPNLSEKKKALEFCKKMKDKYTLPMKFIDAHFSFDGSRITFAFIADGRVDFRELVKELTRHFGKTIRLQQIGIRDEAKIMGDYGHCGRLLCCKGFLCELSSITSEMSELQQCSHRGSERISGICGRLMCCLAYEQKGYEELAKVIPAIGTKVNVDGKKGEIVGQHILKQSVNVRFGGEKGEETIVVEVDLNRNKKKK
jgi:cell fate regulator YaaT (PSP1 superfamily)